MAKLNYSKPMFSVCPIPLEAGGTAGGCAIQTNQAQNFCSVEILGDSVFCEENTDCAVTPQDSGISICYTVPTSDYNVYNS